jgi:type IV pilus assembly protein PilN
MRLTTNLATRRYINLRQLDAGLVTCFVLLGVLALFKVGEFTGNASELSRLKALSQQSGGRPGAPRVSDAQLKAQEARILFANGVIERKSVNWLNLLDHLEEVVPSGVALTVLEPDRSHGLRVTGAARSFANLRELMENMEHSKNFSEVYLLNQSDAKVGLTQQGLNFTLSCKVALR